MIGNDIIDLELARKQSDWKRKGFLGKIFTLPEQERILNSENPELWVWFFWSRKEASYKIFNRQTNLRIYNPLQFECSEMTYSYGFYYGKVRNGEVVYYSKTEITIAFIHTTAVLNPDDFQKIHPLKESVNILKKDGIPFLESDGKLNPVSISHHGKYRRIISI